MLSKLKESGYIDERLHAWTTELRVLRNEGAHFTGALVNREDARDALDLCEAILDYEAYSRPAEVISALGVSRLTTARLLKGLGLPTQSESKRAAENVLYHRVLLS